jgi:hypothetical protein
VFALREDSIHIGADVDALEHALAEWQRSGYLNLGLGHHELRYSPDWLGIE